MKKDLSQGVVAYHGGDLPERIENVSGFGGLHAGSKKAAIERIGRPATARQDLPIYEILVKSKSPYLPDGKILDERDGTDRTKLYLIQQLKDKRQKLIDDGYDVIPYINAVEDPGSISYLILDPKGYAMVGGQYFSPSDINKLNKK